MFNLIVYFLHYKRRQKQKWLNKWILWHTLHPDFKFQNGCESRGCKHWSDKGFHTCPWGCLFVDASLRKLSDPTKIEECHCIEWIKDV